MSPAAPSPPASPCTGSSLGLLFRQLRDGMWAQMERELVRSGHELTFSQFVTIKTLARGIASVTDLARAAELNPGAMTRLLDRLAAKGLVERVADPEDRRALHIHLTDAGVSIWREIEQCGQRVHDRAFGDMPQADRDRLLCLLERVRENLSSEE
ncbi:MarR family winged helix-turn-helix transcriptional regulator [Cognatiluteimonas telluris]|jgi:DNA-binding MarR family transcriptional regulator|uniref:MarR family winged helix-turn-helix transcriptional regulator n=1 Tax=Cognatiluteimonas telluris TaxID=1104775 RepID=UPI001407A73B|nr:MarR family transcriptional regulator [Lysobacter telluris]